MPMNKGTYTNKLNNVDDDSLSLHACRAIANFYLVSYNVRINAMVVIEIIKMGGGKRERKRERGREME